MPTGLSAIAVDLESAVGLALGLVDGGVGRGADDACRGMFGDCRADRVSVANIGLGMGQSYEVTTGRGGELDQMAFNLAASAKHHDPRSHSNALVKRAPSVREAARLAAGRPAYRRFRRRRTRSTPATTRTPGW